MSKRTLSNPQIEVNDVVTAIVPNSLVFKNGKGIKGVKSASAGGNSIEIVITEDAETKKSMVKFQLYNTTTNLQVVKDWQDLYSITIAISDQDFAESFRDMVVINDPDREIGADGNMEIEFEGAPVL